jgi:hypothetical protein
MGKGKKYTVYIAKSLSMAKAEENLELYMPNKCSRGLRGYNFPEKS